MLSHFCTHRCAIYLLVEQRQVIVVAVFFCVMLNLVCFKGEGVNVCVFFIFGALLAGLICILTCFFLYACVCPTPGRSFLVSSQKQVFFMRVAEIGGVFIHFGAVCFEQSRFAINPVRG